MELFDKVLELAQYNNIVLKWSHASENFEVLVYPGDMLTPMLKDAIEALEQIESCGPVITPSICGERVWKTYRTEYERTLI